MWTNSAFLGFEDSKNGGSEDVGDFILGKALARRLERRVLTKLCFCGGAIMTSAVCLSWSIAW